MEIRISLEEARWIIWRCFLKNSGIEVMPDEFKGDENPIRIEEDANDQTYFTVSTYLPKYSEYKK